MIKVALATATVSAMADQGPSTQIAPYVQPLVSGVEFTSLLTSGESVNGYRMVGLPDGLGAYDNNDGTITVLMNHELGNTVGIARAHGGKGTFVSEWVINKKTLEVKSGSDLIKRFYKKGLAGWEVISGPTNDFSRFCSADLAEPSAFFNKDSEKGTRQRIFLNGEEAGNANVRGVAHVATGSDKGSSYVLPWTENANGAWENLLANPYSGNKTVVIGTADGGTNGVYIYVGDKSKTGNDVEKAGLVNGNLYRIAINGGLPETQATDAGLGLTINSDGNFQGTFSVIAGADLTNTTSTVFLRPEDGAWDTKNHNRFYFVTTNQMDAVKDNNANTDNGSKVGRTRLWSLTFKNSANPQLGGKVELLLDGTSAKGDYQMFDNITVHQDGSLTLQEDVGGNQHNGKIWEYNPKTDVMTKIAGFDPILFGDIGLAGSYTKDEESSGIIDITKLLNRKHDKNVYSLLVAQNHTKYDDTVAGFPIDAELVEGGQLLLMSQPKSDHK